MLQTLASMLQNSAKIYKTGQDHTLHLPFCSCQKLTYNLKGGLEQILD